MNQQEQIDRSFAVAQVREMAYQFADMYFTFVLELRERFGDKEAMQITTRVLFRRAAERAKAMVEAAKEKGIARIPQNIKAVNTVPFLGWDASLGCNHCPYGAAWKLRIEKNPWFRPYASLYCDVTDTTIAEVFTGKYSHKIQKNVVWGDESCERIYFLSDAVKQGQYTYDQKE